MPDTAPPALAARGLSVRRAAVPILDRVDIALSPGERVGLIGPNGAGKTTLLRCLAGLARPDSGTVRLDGRPIADWPDAARARQIAYLAQAAECRWPMTVERVVALGRLAHVDRWGALAPADRAAIDRAIDEADVGHLRARAVTTLSGGERARVLLARALAVDAPLLLADEPVAGLDPGHQLQVMALIRRLSDAGRAVVMVLHDLSLAARHFSRLVLLHQGRVVADGPPARVLTAPTLARVYGITARIDPCADGLLVVPETLTPGGASHHTG